MSNIYELKFGARCELGGWYIESHTGEICTVVRFLPRVNHQSYFFPAQVAVTLGNGERAPISQEMDPSDIPIEFRFAVRGLNDSHIPKYHLFDPQES